MEQQRGLCSFTLGSSTRCGAEVSGQPTIRLSITSTTGSPVELTVPRGETVAGLRTHISKQLRLETDRIVLLHRHKQLTAGRLLDLGVTDGSTLILVPVIEAGLVCSTARTQRSMMDVLKSLTEVQISDFLCGRAPLTISMGVGAHVMYVQLQLSAQDVVELQHNQDLRAQSSSECLTGLPTAVRMSHPDPAQINTTGSTTPSTSQSSAPASDSSPSNQFRSAFNSNGLSSNPTACAVTCQHHSSPLQSYPQHTSSTSISNLSLASGLPHPSSQRQAATPACCRRNPAPASSIKEGGIHALSPAELCKQPGAIIESFVSHSPGVFSGTFSGTLAPSCQSGVSHSQNGIAIILQILNDLLRAAVHPGGAPGGLSHPLCPASKHPISPITAEEQSKAKSKMLVTQRAEQLSDTPGEECRHLHLSTQENQALHCKLECLQFLMHQRRLRRRNHRNFQISKRSEPYQQHHNHP